MTMINEAPAVLQAENVNLSFGAINAACDINFTLNRGARHALIGPNGAGKTTFINLLTGRLQPTTGRILLDGKDITKVAVHHRVKRGLVRTFQLNTLLRSLSVLENVQLADLEQRGFGGTLFGGAREQVKSAETAYEILEQLRLSDHASTAVKDLSYGRQRLVEIAVALALKPSVILLDEPAAGVPPVDSHLIFDTIDALPDHISILIIEHDMKLVFRFARRISVLVQGRLMVEGTPDEIASDPMVRDVYLGHRGHD